MCEGEVGLADAEGASDEDGDLFACAFVLGDELDSNQVGAGLCTLCLNAKADGQPFAGDALGCGFDLYVVDGVGECG